MIHTQVKVGILLAGLMMSSSILGQETSASTIKYVEINNTVGEMLSYAFQIRPEGRYVQLKGSPYLDEEWLDGEVLLIGDTLSMRFPMRYNIYGNEMQFVHNQDTFAISNPLKVCEIYLDNKRFVYRAFHHGEMLNLAYFEILNDGDFQLLRRRESVLEMGQRPVTPYHSQIDKHGFHTREIFYYQTKMMEEPSLIPSSRSILIKMEDFKDYREMIKELRINPARERDLDVLFKKINSSLE